MRRLLLLLAASALTASPALAQHQHHQHHPTPAKKPVVKKPAVKKPAAKKPTPKKAVAKKAVAKKPVAKKTSAKGLKPKAARPKPASKSPAPEQATLPAAADPHAGHGMAVQAPAADPHAGHTAPSAPDPHADHAAPKASDPHAGHDMGATVVEPPLGPPPTSAFTGPEHAADGVWGERAMVPSRRAAIREHGDMIAYKVLLDRAETRIGKGRNGYAVDAEAWVGGDRNKAWFKAELDGKRGERPEEAELQALWSRAVDPWFDAQIGIRGDFMGKNRAHLVVGLQGLAPYWVHVDAAAFLSTKGDLTARIEAEHDVRITQQLVLQPRAEVTVAAQEVEAEGLGAGLSSLELGARLRYQVSPLFAPYVGLSLDQAFGSTRRFRRAEGDRAGDLRLLVGIRSWF